VEGPLKPPGEEDEPEENMEVPPPPSHRFICFDQVKTGFLFLNNLFIIVR